MARRRTVVQVQRLRDQVYDLVRDELDAGVLQPGDRIVEADLARRYGVSRTPVREALLQLAREGLLVESAGRLIAPTVSADCVVEARRLHGSLGGPLAAKAAGSGDHRHRLALAEALKAAQTAHSAARVRAFVGACNRFECLLLSMADSELLARLVSLVKDSARSVQHSACRCPEYRAALLSHYAALNEAVQLGDGSCAEHEVRRFATTSICPHPDGECPFLQSPFPAALCGELPRAC